MTPLNGFETVSNWLTFGIVVLVFLMMFVKQVVETSLDYSISVFWLFVFVSAVFYFSVARYVYLGIFHV